MFKPMFRLLGAGLLTHTACAAGDLEPEASESADIAERSAALYPESVNLWPQDVPIPVCWEQAPEATANERAWVRQSVEATWERASNVRFTGWGACPASSKGIRIRVFDDTAHTRGLGKALDGKPNGMSLNFTFQNWRTNLCIGEAAREDCIRDIAAHEFGHALGFSHEHHRPDTNRTTCTKEVSGDNGDTLFGSWDPWSVMNYCNLLHENDGELSELDAAGARALYGTRQISNFGYERGSWRSGRHPRLVADVNDDGRDDIVGFGDAGVIVSLALETGGFESPRQFFNAFGYNQGWRVERHVRTLADVNADGRADIVAFGDDGVALSLSGSTRFYAPSYLNDFGYNQGWRIEQHVRTLADVNGDRMPDIVGFGRDGVWIALSQGGRFAAPQFAAADFGYEQGWRVDQHVRTLADVNGDGRQDLVGFGTYGVLVALSTGTGFSTPSWFSAEFGYNAGYRVQEHPRMLADVDHDGRADIVAFGSDGVRVALSGSVRFYASQRVLADMGTDTGWRVDQHPRFVRDVSGDGRPDLVGFGAAGVYVATALGGSVFGPMQLWALRYSASDAVLRNGSALPFSENVRGLGDFDADGDADVFAFRADGLHTTDLTHHIEALPALATLNTRAPAPSFIE